jgi:hypothetical protein
VSIVNVQRQQSWADEIVESVGNLRLRDVTNMLLYSLQ